MRRAVVTLLASTIATAALAVQPVQTPSALVRALYTNEATFHRGDPSWWGYLAGSAAKSLARAQQVRRATGNEIIDFDFLCQCQDPDGIQVLSVTLSSQAPSRVSARVRFAIGSHPDSLKIDLVKTNHGWRIVQLTNSRGRTFSAQVDGAIRGPGE